MPERTGFDHLVLIGTGRDEPLNRRGGGDSRIRQVEDRLAHGTALRARLREAVEASYDDAVAGISDAELRSLGVTIAITAASKDYPLRLDSLERWSRHQEKRPQWLLLAVQPWHDDRPETAVVWIANEYREGFAKLIEDYLSKNTRPSKNAPDGNPQNNELIANMGDIRRAIARNLWTSPNEPPAGNVWWELVLQRADGAVDVLRSIAPTLSLDVARASLVFDDRIVAWVEGSWASLELLTLTRVQLTEIRLPSRASVVLELSDAEQDEYVADLLDRTTPEIRDASPAICLLDTGVNTEHVLLKHFYQAKDSHTAVGGTSRDLNGHGTAMAGLALYGDLTELLVSNDPIVVRHHIESVKILPDVGYNPRPMYALLTARAVALPEIVGAGRPRLFALAVTAENGTVAGEPTTWSAAIDALAFGSNVDAGTDGSIRLLPADRDQARLFVISAGNIRETPQVDYLTQADLSLLEEPSQSWNALTVGAFTCKQQIPQHPSFHGWSALAPFEELSPHSRTAVRFARQWPIKPDIVMEGGNILHDGTGTFDWQQPTVNLTSTSNRSPTAIDTMNATSAATALAARLCAVLMHRYPHFRPETVRALVVHSAEWTPPMQAQFDAVGKTGRLALLRRYGWGVPNEARTLASAANALTMIIEDTFRPFEGTDHKNATFRLHALPWPRELLLSHAGNEVRLRVTLSYFVEPTVASRGWRRRYSYASHGLRFELRRPGEKDPGFIQRINRQAVVEDEDTNSPTAPEDVSWRIGPNQRNRGSIISDVWAGDAAELAETGTLAVYATGGWWKNNKRKDRVDSSVHYSLIVSLETDAQEIDLYTAVKSQIRTPTPIDV